MSNQLYGGVMDYSILKNEIIKHIDNNEIEKAEKKLDELFQKDVKNIEVYTIKSSIEYIKGNYETAEKTLLDVYSKYEFNFDINYNLGVIKYVLKEYEDALKCFIRASCLQTKDKSQYENVMDIIEDIASNFVTAEKFDQIKENELGILENIHIKFPMDADNQTFIGKDFTIGKSTYYTGIYDHYFKERINFEYIYMSNETSRFFIKTETLEGKKYSEFKCQFHERYTVPIMILEGNQEVYIEVEGKDKITLGNLLHNRFYYYTFEAKENIRIFSHNEFVIGKIIEHKVDAKKPKVVLGIFVDGLSQEYLKKHGFKKCMPRTHEFFSKGTVCSNTYSTGEWTHVSITSIFSGMYTSNHRIYHPTYSSYNLKNYKLYPEVLNEKGYFCASINGDWRSAPISGYAKGMDRTVYQASVLGMHGDEAVAETIEHLSAFKDKNNFVWMCIPDLHDVADEYQPRISTQINMKFKDRLINKTYGTSVRKLFDEKKINRYEVELKRIDTLLSNLFNYIEKNYLEEEYVVGLISDHGQGYLINTEEFLEEERSNVAMMFRGNNIPQGECSELTQGLDFFPIILKSIDIEKFHIKDTNIPKWFNGNKERDYTITESLFPGSPYRAVINDKKFKLFFETKYGVTDDGRINIKEYKTKLIKKDDNSNVTEENLEIVDKYTEIIVNHIREFITEEEI